MLALISLARAQNAVWERLLCPCDGVDLTDVDFVNADTGYTVGGPFVVRTTDAGRTWLKIEPKEAKGQSFHAVSFPTAHTGYVAGEYVFKTTDAGMTWDSVHRVLASDGTRSYAVGIGFNSELYGHVLGPAGAVYSYTTNGGATWINQIGGCSYCETLIVRGDSIAFFGGWTQSIAGVGGEVMMKYGKKYIFPPNLNKISSSFRVNALEAIMPHHLWVGGNRYKSASFTKNIAFTSDSGLTWHEPQTELPYTITAMAFADELHGFAGDNQGDIYLTTDGGFTWELDYDGILYEPINDIAISGNTIVAVGNQRVILRRTVPVSVQELPHSGKITMHPNPTVGPLTITLDEDGAQEHTISVVDMFGQTSMHTTFVGRTFAVELSPLPPGMYRVVVSSLNAAVSQGVVLLK
ncbi:MAG: hypothetical protein HQ472_05260 [Ignavibacteria bacterium]|nr:hypothetical protein [Ignavibacteria bacterium]